MSRCVKGKVIAKKSRGKPRQCWFDEVKESS